MCFRTLIRTQLCSVLPVLAIVLFPTFGCAKDPDWRSSIKKLPAAGSLVWEKKIPGAYTATFSPDGKLFCIGHQVLQSKVSISLWETDGPRHIADLRGHRGDVTEVAFSPDGQLLATTGGDSTLRVWKVSDQTELFVVKLDRGESHCVAFSGDSQRVACGTGAQVQIWDVKNNGAAVGKCEIKDMPNALLFASKRNEWIVGDRSGRITICNAATFETVFEHPSARKGLIESLSATADESVFLSSNSDSARIALWSFDGKELTTKREIPSPSNSRGFCSAGISPDGQIVVASYSRSEIGLLVIDAASGEWLGHDDREVTRVFASPANGHFLSLNSREKSCLFKIGTK